MMRRLPGSTLFPYGPLFGSVGIDRERGGEAAVGGDHQRQRVRGRRGVAAPTRERVPQARSARWRERGAIAVGGLVWKKSNRGTSHRVHSEGGGGDCEAGVGE